MVAVFAIPLLVGKFGRSSWQMWIGIAVMAALVLTYKPLKQQVEFVTEGAPVSLTLWMNLFCQLIVRMETPSGVKSTKLGRYIGIPVWFEHTIEVADHPRRLLVYFRFPNGFMVSHGLNDKVLTITRNEICL